MIGPIGATLDCRYSVEQAQFVGIQFLVIGPYFRGPSAPILAAIAAEVRRGRERKTERFDLHRIAKAIYLPRLFSPMLGLFKREKASNEFLWTCGGSSKVSHERHIKTGGGGEVHVVTSSLGALLMPR